MDTESGTSVDMSATAGWDDEATTCEGLLVMECETTFSLKAEATVGLSTSTSSTSGSSQSSTSDYSFSETVSTSYLPDLKDGLGDLFLIQSGAYSIQQAYIIGVSVNESVCTAYKTPTISWTKDPSATVQWTSAYDIINTIIPDLLLINNEMLQQYGASDGASLTAANHDAGQNYNNSVTAINGWNALLALNDELKAEAVPWQEFYSVMSASGITASPDSGSLTFYGGQGDLVFEVSMETSSSKEYNNGNSLSIEGSLGGSLAFNALGAEVSLDLSTVVSSTQTLGTTNEHGTSKSNTFTITLADPDLGDEFKIQIFRDPVFGSPVFKTIAGQSRCDWEANTVSRDAIELRIATPVFDNLNPNDAVATSLMLINNSPTGESFPYTLTLAEETDPYGLWLQMNGETLSQGSTIVYNVNAGQVLSPMISITRGTGQYNFPNLQITAAGTGMVTNQGFQGACQSSTATFSVSYIEPCSKVSLLGDLAAATLLVNEANAGTPIPIIIRNPEYAISGRTWTQMASSTGNTQLQYIIIQYRDSAIDAVWIPIEPINGGELDILGSLEVNDYYAALWDPSVLPDDTYSVRGVAQCNLPADATDESLYISYSAVGEVVVDTTPPFIFGVPVPSLAQGVFYPGDAIAVTYSEDISCTYAKATITIVGTNPASTVANTIKCSGAVLNVALYNPSWDDLVGQQLLITVTGVQDLAGNPAVADASWYIDVGQWNVVQSPVQLSSLSFNDTSVDIQSNLTELASELVALVNSAIDQLVKPTPSPPASNSSDGLQASQLQFSVVPTSSSRTSVQVTIYALSSFHQAAVKPRFTPSTFGSTLFYAIESGLVTDQELLSLLLPTQHIDVSTTPLPENIATQIVSTSSSSQTATQQRRFRTLGNTPSDAVTEMSSQSYVLPSQDTTLSLAWQTSSTVPYTNAPNVQYALIDPVTQTVTSTYTSYTYTDSNHHYTTQSPTDGSTGVIYNLVLAAMPLIVGGHVIEVQFAQGSHMSWSAQLWLAGTPASSLVSSAVQTNMNTVTVTATRCSSDGVSEDDGDTAASYVLLFNGTAVTYTVNSLSSTTTLVLDAALNFSTAMSPVSNLTIQILTRTSYGSTTSPAAVIEVLSTPLVPANVAITQVNTTAFELTAVIDTMSSNQWNLNLNADGNTTAAVIGVSDLTILSPSVGAYTMVLPSSWLPITSLTSTWTACNEFSCSMPGISKTFHPIYVTAIRSPRAQWLTDISTSTAATLLWVPPKTVLPDSTYLLGYRAFVRTTDLVTFATASTVVYDSTITQLGIAHTQLNLTTLPLSSLDLTYVFTICSVLGLPPSSSGDQPVEWFEDGCTTTTLTSTSADVMAIMSTISEHSYASTNHISHALYHARSYASGGTTNTTITPLVVSNGATTSAGTPSAISELTATSVSSDGAVTLAWNAVPNAKLYTVAWYAVASQSQDGNVVSMYGSSPSLDQLQIASGLSPLSTIVVDPRSQIDGIVTHRLTDSSLIVSGSESKKVFRMSVAAVNDAGTSDAISNFVTVDSAEETVAEEAADKTMSALMPWLIAVTSLQALLVALLLCLVFRRRVMALLRKFNCFGLRQQHLKRSMNDSPSQSVNRQACGNPHQADVPHRRAPSGPQHGRSHSLRNVILEMSATMRRRASLGKPPAQAT